METNTNVSKYRSFFNEYLWIPCTLAFIAGVWLLITLAGPASAEPQTVEQMQIKIKELREEKFKIKKDIAEKEKAVILIDQQIMKFKCDSYNKADAAIQWKNDCEAYFEAQQSKTPEPQKIPTEEEDQQME